jgi:hypothetical protein
MALDDDLNVPFDNMQDWKAILEKAGEISITNAYRL